MSSSCPRTGDVSGMDPHLARCKSPTPDTHARARAHVPLSAPKRLLSSPIRNLLRVRLAGDVHQLGQHRRLEIHSLIEKGSNLRLSKMHVLVEPINGPDAEQWVEMAMSAAYGGERGWLSCGLLNFGTEEHCRCQAIQESAAARESVWGEGKGEEHLQGDCAADT
jgi:hypothetical protein